MNSGTILSKNSNQMDTFLLNPIVRKVSKIEERDDTCATYSGIRKKTAFFLAIVFVGALLSFIVHTIPFNGITDDNGIFVSYLEMGIGLISLVFIIVCPFLAIFLRKTTPVTGSLSCIGNGFILGTVSVIFPEYRGPMLLAFLITIALVTVLLYVFFSGKVNVSKKFKMTVCTLFGVIVMGNFLLGICFFIPGCKDIFTYVQSNPLLSIGVSIGGIIIAIFFLIMDFDTIRNTVEKKLPKKYEWQCAYALAFTIIWIYFKILDLIMTAQKNQVK